MLLAKFQVAGYSTSSVLEESISGASCSGLFFTILLGFVDILGSIPLIIASLFLLRFWLDYLKAQHFQEIVRL